MKAIFIAFLFLASMAFLLPSATLATREVQPIKGDEEGYIGARAAFGKNPSGAYTKRSDPYRFRRRRGRGGREGPPRPPPPPSAVA